MIKVVSQQSYLPIEIIPAPFVTSLATLVVPFAGRN